MKYKASEIFTPEEAEFVKFLLKLWNGTIVKIEDIDEDIN